MRKQKVNNGPIPIESTKHTDTRVNIPTEELRGFMESKEKKAPVIIYPRDTSLDPQLVWKGKDEQDTKDLEVPAVCTSRVALALAVYKQVSHITL